MKAFNPRMIIKSFSLRLIEHSRARGNFDPENRAGIQVDTLPFRNQLLSVTFNEYSASFTDPFTLARSSELKVNKLSIRL